MYNKPEVWTGHPAIIKRKEQCECDNVLFCDHLVFDFKCPYCEEGYAVSEHILGPYKCPSCGEKFMAMVEGYTDRTDTYEKEEKE
jgi:transposase-like protein